MRWPPVSDWSFLDHFLKTSKKDLMMSEYYVAHEVDLRCYPNYSLTVGDIDGDGQKELVSLNQGGTRLRVQKLNGDLVLEKTIFNKGNWGTLQPCMVDVDGDGREEVIVPVLAPRLEASLVAFNAEGEIIREFVFGSRADDDFGITVPLTAPFRFQDTERPGILAAVAGGTIVALDADFNEIWRVDGFRNDFGHEFYIHDIDGDGLDEVVFCTVDHCAGSPFGEWNIGEFVMMDHDGTVLMRRQTTDYMVEHHFDDFAFGDFTGNGQMELLIEKGFLTDLKGNMIWDISKEFDHGQWIAHTPDPNGPGRLIFISELWGHKGKSALFRGDGTKITDTAGLPWSTSISNQLPGWGVLPTRVHTVQWTPDSEPEFFLAEQTVSPSTHNCFKTEHFELKAFFLDINGKLKHAMPFKDAQIEGYWYNGEVSSIVDDVDGDGMQEVVFPRQDGKVMIIKKGRSGCRNGLSISQS